MNFITTVAERSILSTHYRKDLLKSFGYLHTYTVRYEKVNFIHTCNLFTIRIFYNFQVLRFVSLAANVLGNAYCGFPKDITFNKQTRSYEPPTFTLLPHP